MANQNSDMDDETLLVNIEAAIRSTKDSSQLVKEATERMYAKDVAEGFRYVTNTTAGYGRGSFEDLEDLKYKYDSQGFDVRVKRGRGFNYDHKTHNVFEVKDPHIRVIMIKPKLENKVQ